MARKHLTAHRQVALPKGAVPIHSQLIDDSILDVLFKYCYSQTFIYAFENSIYAKMTNIEGEFSYYKVEIPTPVEP